jgi:hypothetical protein
VNSNPVKPQKTTMQITEIKLVLKIIATIISGILGVIGGTEASDEK